MMNAVDKFCTFIKPGTEFLIDQARDAGLLSPKGLVLGDNQLLRASSHMLAGRAIIGMTAAYIAFTTTSPLVAVAGVVAAVYLAVDFVEILECVYMADGTLGRGAKGAASFQAQLVGRSLGELWKKYSPFS